MKILTPLNSINNLGTLIKNGANEFYCGFYDNKWEAKFGEHSGINRMSEFKDRANSFTFEALIKLNQKINELGGSLFLTINSLGYSEQQYSFIDSKYFKRLKTLNIGGVIVSDHKVAKLAQSNGISAVASTICGVYNSDIANYYLDLGVKRIILPRDLSLRDIDEITKKLPGVEFEVFLMRNGCIFSDSHCLSFHGIAGGSLCTVLRKSEKKLYNLNEDFESKNMMAWNNLVYCSAYHIHACGLCAIYRLIQFGITAVKIVGRSEPGEQISEDVALVSKNIGIAKKCTSENEYLRKMIFPKNRDLICSKALSCYYPEIRFPI